jgi:hypothetical protein
MRRASRRVSRLPVQTIRSHFAIYCVLHAPAAATADMAVKHNPRSSQSKSFPKERFACAWPDCIWQQKLLSLLAAKPTSRARTKTGLVEVLHSSQISRCKQTRIIPHPLWRQHRDQWL